MENISVFVTGGTGYLGTPLIRMLLDRGHKVRALVACRKVTITSCYASKLVWRQVAKSPSPRTNV